MSGDGAALNADLAAKQIRGLTALFDAVRAEHTIDVMQQGLLACVCGERLPITYDEEGRPAYNPAIRHHHEKYAAAVVAAEWAPSKVADQSADLDTIRHAAALMRERAEKARTGDSIPGDFWHHDLTDEGTVIAEGLDRWTAEHIAGFGPAVALTVAKAMDDVADAWEICDGWTRDLDDDSIRFEDTVDGGWLNVARAYLGEDA